jgi:hypothetical protein
MIGPKGRGLLVKMRLLGAAALAAAIGTCAPASATLIDAIWTGTVGPAGGTIDGAGLFGPTGANLSGDSFTATFELDTSKGTPWFAIPAGENYLIGGSLYGQDSPVIDAKLTINGKTATVSGAYNGSVQAFDGYPSVGNQQWNGVYYGKNSLWLYVADAFLSPSGNIPITFDVPFSLTFGSADAGSGFLGYQTAGLDTSLNLSPTSLTYEYPTSAAPAAGAPEPSTWAMMLLGFAGLGYAGYRGRRSAVAAAL